MKNDEERAASPDEVAGMMWWNAMSEDQRAKADAGTATLPATVALAWAHWKRKAINEGRAPTLP